MALQLTVVTPEGQVFDEAVEHVVLPGSEGDFGVYEQHERFLTAIQPGALEIRGGEGAVRWAALSDGFADVGADQVTVLVSRCDLAQDIDAEATQQELEEIEASLAALSDAEEDAAARSELEARRAQAEVRQRLANG
jgi:F-type H+-transporting ATPase subunit epsilon